ncbi:unnamed protein product [Sphagnum tenellum]
MDVVGMNAVKKDVSCRSNSSVPLGLRPTCSSSSMPGVSQACLNAAAAAAEASLPQQQRLATIDRMNGGGRGGADCLHVLVMKHSCYDSHQRSIGRHQHAACGISEQPYRASQRSRQTRKAGKEAVRVACTGIMDDCSQYQ